MNRQRELPYQNRRNAREAPHNQTVPGIRFHRGLFPKRRIQLRKKKTHQIMANPAQSLAVFAAYRWKPAMEQPPQYFRLPEVRLLMPGREVAGQGHKRSAPKCCPNSSKLFHNDRLIEMNSYKRHLFIQATSPLPAGDLSIYKQSKSSTI